MNSEEDPDLYEQSFEAYSRFGTYFRQVIKTNDQCSSLI